MKTRENLGNFAIIGKAIKNIFAHYGSVAPVALVVWLTATAVGYVTLLGTGQNPGMVIVLNVLSLLILAPLYFGQMECSYDAASGKPYTMSQFFSWFTSVKLWWSIKVNVYIGLRLFLWFLLLSFVGVIGATAAFALGGTDDYHTNIAVYLGLVAFFVIALFFLMIPYFLGQMACSKKADGFGTVGEVMRDTKVLLSFCKGKFIGLMAILIVPQVLVTAPALYYIAIREDIPILLSTGLDLVRFFIVMPIFYGAIAVFLTNHQSKQAIEQPDQPKIEQ